MPDLLLEFFSEEIPARMQARAAEDLKKLVTDKLVGAGLTYEGATAFATPRRLALAIAGIPVRQPDVKEERKGPRVDANEKAIAGFLKAAGLTSVEQAKIEKDPKKGDFYVAVIEKAGRPAIEVIGEIVAEVAGLVEWPVVLMGSFDQAFIAIPEEVIRATIRNNQKCFVVRDQNTAKLANKFILVSNIEASDGGKAIVAGNERVIRARLSDAKFFYETDLKTKLEDRLPKFEQIVFHEKLGTQAERIARITALAKELAPLVKADVEKTKRAARLCKADLLTDMVGEFPELQGLMGKYYAEAQGEDEAVAHACED